MHELSLCRSIGSIVEKVAEGRRVAVVEIEVGHLRQVVPETLVHCWTLITQGTDLANSRLEIQEKPCIVACQDCDKETTLTESPILECGFCTSKNVTLIAGEEFMVTSLVLED
ncbi:MAG: hydrogenase maturation nickel metallochaperone HypA [Propionibacteriaceae bacterium]|jgi:hydrogenase nickel incorporation protein HypA/HybF|nr:hydrogenase maturation nickel metallochaperone HypA [Propionibacteriaceae bacterium]